MALVKINLLLQITYLLNCNYSTLSPPSQTLIQEHATIGEKILRIAFNMLHLLHLIEGL